MMFKFICKTLLHVRYSVKISSNLNPNLLQYLRFSSGNPDPFTVSYLINSCGFSLEIAKKVSKRVAFETPEKPDLVLDFLKNNGFTEFQISHIIQRQPMLLLSNPEKTLLPKLIFFHSKGISSPEIAKIFNINPYILKRSIKKHIIPAFDFLKSFLLTDEKTIAAIKRCPSIISHTNFVTVSVKLFRDVGVPDSSISSILLYQPRIFITGPNRLLKVLEDVKRVGFDPSRQYFVHAVRVMLAISKSTWEKKLDAFKKWGWSEEDVVAAFRRYPLCMSLSEEKIALLMNFFVKELGWEPLRLAECPVLFSYSLEKRLIPRAFLLQFLFEKGLSPKTFMNVSPFICSELVFLQKFVYSHPKQADQLLKIFKEKLDSGIKSKMLEL